MRFVFGNAVAGSSGRNIMGCRCTIFIYMHVIVPLCIPVAHAELMDSLSSHSRFLIFLPSIFSFLLPLIFYLFLILVYFVYLFSLPPFPYRFLCLIVPLSLRLYQSLPAELIFPSPSLLCTSCCLCISFSLIACLSLVLSSSYSLVILHSIVTASLDLI